MEKHIKQEQNFELRSEKVRSIVGQIPPLLVRIGITVMTLVIIVIVSLMYFIPYPQTKKLDVVVNKIGHEYFAEGKVLIKDAKSVKKGQKVEMSIFTLNGDFTLGGEVFAIIESKGYVYIEIKILSSNDSRLQLLPSGTAIIHISNTSILKRILFKRDK